MLLSICIPSYNRFDHLCEILLSLNKCTSNDFEVVIVDNGSKSDVKAIVCPEKFDFPIRIIERNPTVSGIMNPRDCINFGKGLYRFLCMDKDFIDGTKLSDFIANLQTNTEVHGGYCTLNAAENRENSYFTQKDFSSRAYKINHPSGVFLREDILKEDNETLDYLNPESIYCDFPFIYDLAIARCMYYGKILVYNAPLVRTESEDEAKTTKTYSYNENNLFFLPVNKRRQMYVYFDSMNKLIKDKQIYYQTMNRMFRQFMVDNSINYIRIMSNEKICSHYGLQTRKVSKREALTEMSKCRKEIIRSPDCRMPSITKSIITEILSLMIATKMMIS